MTDRKRVSEMPVDELEDKLRRAIFGGRVTGDDVGKAWGFIKANNPEQYSIDWARAMVLELRRPEPMGPMIDEGDAR